MPARRPRVSYRTGPSRARKWYAKMRGDIVGVVIDEVRDLALERVEAYQSIHESIISLVRDVLSNYPSAYPVMQEYMWYAQRIWRIAGKYSGAALRKEADAVFLYYYARGLEEEPLRLIARGLGVEISGWDRLLGMVGLSEDVVYRGTKRALKETLERVETDLTDAEFIYDADGNLVEIVKYDKVIGRTKRIRLEYDAQGNLVRKIEEWV